MAGETDAAQTLHCHSLIWLVGDSNILEKLQKYSRCPKHRDFTSQSFSDNVEVAPSPEDEGDAKCAHDIVSVQNTPPPLLPHGELQFPKKDNDDEISNEDNGDCCEACVEGVNYFAEAFVDFLDETITTELSDLGDDTIYSYFCCSTCNEELQLDPEITIDVLRNRVGKEVEVLYCPKCEMKVSITEHLWGAFGDYMYERYPGYKVPSLPNKKPLILWLRLDKDDKPFVHFSLKMFMLQNHDPLHKRSCFKNFNNDGSCRYKLPGQVSLRTKVRLRSSDGLHIDSLTIVYKRRPPFMYMSKFNSRAAAVLQCNTNLKYVYSARIGYYWASYATKVAREAQENLSLAKAILNRVLHRFFVPLSNSGSEYAAPPPVP